MQSLSNVVKLIDDNFLLSHYILHFTSKELNKISHPKFLSDPNDFANKRIQIAI